MLKRKEAKELILDSNLKHIYNQNEVENLLSQFVIKNRKNGKHCSCSKCGNIIENDSVQVCPSCGTNFIKDDYTFYSQRYHYFLFSTIQEIDNDVVLVRNYEVKYFVELNKPMEYRIYEVMRNIISSDYHISSRLRTFCYGCYEWGFAYDSNFSIKRYDSKYDLTPKKIFFDVTSTKFKHIDFNYTFNSPMYKKLNTVYSTRFALSQFVSLAYCCKSFEFFLKKESYDVLSILYKNMHFEKQLIKYVNTNNNTYLFDFIKHLENLEFLGMDIKNPTLYLCDVDFRTQIQRRVWRKRGDEESLRKLNAEKEKIEREKEMCENYIKRVADLLDLDLGNEEYEIKILRDVPEFLEIGQEMHNCVYSMGYYKNATSFIFKIVDRESQDIVELCELKQDSKMELFIKQCYGHCNKRTENHDNIVNVINSNIGLLQERL